MLYTSEALQQLMEEFSRLPGIGRKSAQRIALFLLKQPREEVVRMARAMVAQFKADGLLLAPSRSCETDFRNGYIGIQRIFKDEIPTVEYDSDQVDVRKMDLPGAQRKTELFVRLMEARKKGGA
jgi:hypothetical protein